MSDIAGQAQLQVIGDEAFETKTSKHDKFLVAAIDFGTTYSGYAYSLKREYEIDNSKIIINQKWVAGSMSLLSLKAPTAVLFDSKKKFHSFGFEAEDYYSELALDKKHQNWYLFRQFKMRLHDKEKLKLHRETEIEDVKGRKMKAKDVFGAAIKYLKQHLLDMLETRGTGFENKDIHWILTVPAIWTDSAKQFMREAAYKADIDGDQLSIALEPEAAALNCIVTHKDDFKSSKGATFSLAAPGTKYMVIDLGGGTADITVHERQRDGGLREIHKASGGAWGGTQVDEEFYQLLIRIIGAPVFQKFREEHTADFLSLQRELETKKRVITPKSSGKITIKVPSRIGMLYLKMMKEEIEDAIEESRYAGQITWDVDKMRLNADIFKGLFQPCADKIVNHIKVLLQKPDVAGTSIFLMVGGFSESEMMQHAIKTAFPKVRIVVPEDAGLTVVKGAVNFGYEPGVKSRVSKYTYGINISPPFDPAIHPEDHRVTVDGTSRCRDVFKKYIHEGELINVNEPRTGKHITLKANQKEMLLKIFASEKKDPKFTDEEGSEYLGKVIVNIPGSEKKTTVVVSMMFGKTELTVEAEPKQSEEMWRGTQETDMKNTKFKAYFDFL
ncbi:heat shock 70 kDa protein 12A-like [Mercenaria mercenaria]|uniref:heat shock 70 kDa protein 12A-like n=1 Tax=Mercenaria mercenaria TaxID=6596 RepID=UPI00234F6F24|nr:heat shock 70 kDa protein 12A-like [Mercenaria mercenaria]